MNRVNRKNRLLRIKPHLYWDGKYWNCISLAGDCFADTPRDAWIGWAMGRGVTIGETTNIRKHAVVHFGLHLNGR